jgi:hypothetical protein
VDPNKRGIGYYNFRDRKFAVSMFTFGLTLWFVLIFIGYYMRGPGWELYMPWEVWDPHRPPSSTEGLRNMPNLLGFLFLAACGGIGMLAPRFLFKKFYETLGPVRYAVVMFFVLAMFFVPVKIILRNFFDIKYIMSFPSFSLNI